MANHSRSTPSKRSGPLGPALTESLRASLSSLPERPTITHHAAFEALNSIEEALVDVEGAVFMVDQVATHGEYLDDAGRAFGNASRLLLVDVGRLRGVFSDAFQSLLNKEGGAA